MLFFPLEKFPIVKAGWSLNYEMYFYLVFAVLLKFSCLSAMRISVGIVLVSMLAGVFFGGSPTSRTHIMSLVTDPLLLEFVAGAAIGSLHQHHKLSIQNSWILPFAAVSWVVVAMTYLPFESYRVLVWGVPAGFLVVYALNVATFFAGLTKFLQTIGDASFSIYLSHSFVISVVNFILKRVTVISLSLPAYLLVILVVAIGVGIVVLRMCEQPITRGFRRLAFLG